MTASELTQKQLFNLLDSLEYMGKDFKMVSNALYTMSANRESNSLVILNAKEEKAINKILASK